MVEEKLRTLERKSQSGPYQLDRSLSPSRRLAHQRPCAPSTTKPREEPNSANAPSSSQAHYTWRRLPVGEVHIHGSDTSLPNQSSTASRCTFLHRNAKRRFSKSAIPQMKQEYGRTPRRKTRQDRYEFKDLGRLRKQPLVKERGRKVACENQPRRKLRPPIEDGFKCPNVLQDRITVGK